MHKESVCQYLEALISLKKSYFEQLRIEAEFKPLEMRHVAGWDDWIRNEIIHS